VATFFVSKGDIDLEKMYKQFQAQEASNLPEPTKREADPRSASLAGAVVPHRRRLPGLQSDFPKGRKGIPIKGKVFEER